MPVPTTDKFTKIDVAAHSGAFGDNPLPLPSDNQKKAGNYKKGKVSLYGLTVSIEQPKNSYRTGVDSNGKRWTNRLAANYGYINGTKGNDNDPVDCFIGSYPQSDTVYIINQFVNGVFDEHKVMLCYPAESFARCDYEMSYSRDWNGLHSIVTATIKQFKQWLKNGDMTKPLTASDLPITEIEQMQKIQWDENGLPKNTSVAKIIYDLRKTDDGGQLLDSITVDDVYHDYGKLFDSSETAYLDSLNIPFGKINQTANIIKRELNKKGTKLKVKEPLEGENPNPFISEPFKQNGVAMVSILFTLSDGQSIKIFFHDPDPTSSKMDKADIIIAWKWMLNKKDITILVSPELGQDVKLATIAQRIMTMAEGNMEAFARANKNLAEQIKQINELETEINSLGMVLQAKQGEFETVKAKYDDWLVNKATNPEPAPVVTPENGFTPTHKYHDASEGVDVLIAKNENGEWEDANGITYLDIDSEVESITGEQVAVDVAANTKSSDFDPTLPENYKIVMQDKELQLYWQDVLDSFIIGRLTDTRNELFKLGWEANYNDPYPKKNGNRLLVDFIHVGAGKNLVGYGFSKFSNDKGKSFIDFPEIKDDLVKTPAEIAKYVDDMVSSLSMSNQPTPQPEPVEPRPTQGIDPIAKANIEAANISAAIKKKAIAYLNENPSSHQLAEKETPAIKKAKDVILSNLVVALKSEIMSLSPLFYVDSGNDDALILGEQSNADHLRIEINKERIGFVLAKANGVTQNLLDATSTIEDLRSWGFAPPFDLDVKAFVANVIKPVVDEFLSKQAETVVEQASDESVENEQETPDTQTQDTGPEVETELPVDEPMQTEPEPEPAKPLTEIQQYELKLSRLQATQDRMKAVNKIIKSKTLTDDQKRAKLEAEGFTPEIAMVGKPDFAGRIGYADYELTNNNAKIKSTQARINELKKRDLAASMAASGDRQTSYDFDGGTIDLDYNDDRLRINFNSKPSSEMIGKLKSNGFKWSPSNSAWQRQLTDNAIWATNYLLGTEIKNSNDLIRDLQNKGDNVPTPEPQLPVEETPTNTFDADIEALRSETDYTVFDAKLDELAGKIEEIGLMEQYEPQLNELADLLTELLKKAAA